jgi:nucleoside-diphosphate-sugar epimerase
MFDLHGKVALVTGAASGIGAATARVFAEAGADVVLAWYPPDGHDIDPVREAVEKAGRRALVVAVDVCSAADVDAAVEQAVDDQRDLAVESMYEYGSRAGIWRLFRIFDAAGVPVTFFASAVALERNPDVADKLRRRGDEAAGHGYRWSNHYEMTPLHPRITGNPARSDALAWFIAYAQQFDDVAFMRRIDIARTFAEQVPAPQAS